MASKGEKGDPRGGRPGTTTHVDAPIEGRGVRVLSGSVLLPPKGSAEREEIQQETSELPGSKPTVKPGVDTSPLESSLFPPWAFGESKRERLHSAFFEHHGREYLRRLYKGDAESLVDLLLESLPPDSRYREELLTIPYWIWDGGPESDRRSVGHLIYAAIEAATRENVVVRKAPAPDLRVRLSP